jgi:two-component system, OmpR family, phosphate regulon sensor histidine kinase PhoR
MVIPKSRLFLKIMGSYLLLLFAVLLIVDISMARRIHQNYMNHEENRLGTAALILSATLPDARDTALLQNWVQNYGAHTGFRITIVDSEGKVLADNQSDPAQMDNHANRPEIQQAWRAGTGSSIRLSRTLDKNELYFARRAGQGSDNALILRLALPLQEISAGFRTAQKELLLVSLIPFLLALVFGYFLTRSLAQRISKIQEFSEDMARGNFSARVKEITPDELGKLSLSLNATADEMQRFVNELREERNRVTAILEGVRAGVLATDSEERITLMNPTLARMLQLEPKDSVGRKVLEIVRNVELKQFFDRVSKEKKEVKATIQINLSSPRVFEVVAVPLNESAPLASGVVAVLHDITRLKELEAIRRDFVANVSHELRTPLTSIRGFAETLLEGGLEDKKNNRRFVEIIKTHAIHLSELTSELLSLATLESEGFSLNYQEFDLKVLVHEVVESTRSLASRKKQAIAVKMADELPRFEADRDRIGQVLTNLLDNAIKFTAEEGKIMVQVNLASTGDALELHVQDNGIGIPSADLPRVFERFYRVNKVRSRDQGGTGLGLAIVKHIVEAHQGRIDVRSALGQGSEFTVILPI